MRAERHADRRSSPTRPASDPSRGQRPEDAPSDEPSDGRRAYEDYRDGERRRALFGVLASTLVRELRGAGFDSRELLGLVSTLVERITDEEAARRDGTEPEHETNATGIRATRGEHTTELGCERVFLRPPRTDDRERLVAWSDDPLVRESLAPELLEHVLGSLGAASEPDRLDLMACDASSSQPFGLVSLSRIDRERGQAEIAKLIGDPAFRRRGLAAAATHELLEHGFHALGLERIYLRTLGGNLPNIRLNERMGFRFEGVLREAHVRDGRRYDVVLMALLRREYDQLVRSRPR